MDSDEFNSVAGNVLRQFRKTKGLSQEQVALEAELDRTYISLLERGLRQPSMKALFLIARAIGVRPHEVVKAIEDQLNTK